MHFINFSLTFSLYKFLILFCYVKYHGFFWFGWRNSCEFNLFKLLCYFFLGIEIFISDKFYLILVLYSVNAAYIEVFIIIKDLKIILLLFESWFLSTKVLFKPWANSFSIIIVQEHTVIAIINIRYEFTWYLVLHITCFANLVYIFF